MLSLIYFRIAINNLPSILTRSFQIYVWRDTAFGTIKLITKIRTQNSFQALVGIAKTRKLQDGRKVSEIKTRGQQVYLNGLSIPVFLSWVWLKRDGKRVQRFIISTKPMKGKTITRWGKRRWQIEGFFKTVKHCKASSSFWSKYFNWSLSLANSLFCFLLIIILDLFTFRRL
jgi:hypothetical protein